MTRAPTIGWQSNEWKRHRLALAAERCYSREDIMRKQARVHVLYPLYIGGFLGLVGVESLIASMNVAVVSCLGWED